MANSKQVTCLVLLMLLISKMESRSLEASMETKKISAKGGSQELIQKSQLLKASFAKGGNIFPNLYDTNRLSPQGPDPRHH
uniref:CLAVATA3/ESR-related 40 n=1 Tax=Lotus japonicus TaxID=34305 RepID=A0A193PE95_LOTJA|nr:CLAVATA3/ESR-related 40 [Lotus japonicus]